MILLLKSTIKIDAEFVGSAFDAAEICWSDKEISVDNSTIPLIVYYLKSCADTLSVLQSRKKRDELLSILSLKIHDAIPAINKAFYEGNIDYSTVHELHKLFDYIEPYLNTQAPFKKKRNKRNWIKIRCTRSVQKQVIPLIIRANQTEKEEACNTLIVVKKPGYRMNRQIPLPYMDNPKKPSKIVVPFLAKPRFNLNDTDSNNLLVKYYITGIKCLSLSSEHNQDILVFNRNFYIWLLKCILPKLSRNEVLYPAFGGVFKILDTIQDEGLIDLNREIENNVGIEICLRPSTLLKVEPPLRKSGKVAIASSSFCIIITLILTSFLFLTWLLIVFLFIFCRCCRYHQIKRTSCNGTSLLIGASTNSEPGSKTSLFVKKEELSDVISTIPCGESEKKPATNEIYAARTENQPLLFFSEESELKCSKSNLEVQAIAQEPEKSGFSRFLAPLSKTKPPTMKDSCLQNVNKRNSKIVIRSGCDNTDHLGNYEEFQCDNGMSLTIEEKIKAENDQKSSHYQDSSLFLGKIDQPMSNNCIEEPSLKHSDSCLFKEMVSKATVTDACENSCTSSEKTDEEFNNVQVDSSYKCEIKFCGEPPKCEQCSLNFYNDVKQMLQVLKSEELACVPLETPDDSITSCISVIEKLHKKKKDESKAKDKKKDNNEEKPDDDEKANGEEKMLKRNDRIV